MKATVMFWGALLVCMAMFFVGREGAKQAMVDGMLHNRRKFEEEQRERLTRENAPSTPAAKTKGEFDRAFLVESRNEAKGWQVLLGLHGGPIVAKKDTVGTRVYRAETKYGRYLQADNMVIADGPGGRRHYFQFDPKTLEAWEYAPDNVAFDPNAPGPDVRMKCPDSCARCHERKAKE